MPVTLNMPLEALLAAAQEAQLEGRLDIATRLLEEALRARPGDASIWNNLAAVMLALGRPVDAESFARRAVALRPGYALAQANLGRALLAQGRVSEGEGALLDAAQSAPRDPDPAYLLAESRFRRGAWTEAAEAYARSLGAASSPQAHSGLAATRLKMGEPGEAIAQLERGAARHPERAADFASYRLFALHFDAGRDAGAIAEAHRDWARTWGPAAGAPRPARIPKPKIRLGFVSPAFRASAMAFALLPLWRALDRSRFEVFAYHAGIEADAMTGVFAGLADRWSEVAALDDAALAGRIAADAVDVLVDLAGHTPGHRLGAFALRPAPAQASWLDYLDTTGLGAIDALVVDDAAATALPAARFAERLASAGPVRLAYAPPAYAPPVTPPPMAARGHPTFGCFARWAKATPATRAAWRALLGRVPASRLLLKCDAFSDPAMRERVAGEFAAAGIAPARIDLRAEGSHAAMLAEVAEVDIVLDTFPYNGGITTLEALWMGRPVVTLRGDTLASLQGASLVTAAGLADLVAPDAAGYVDRAAALAADGARVARLAAGLRASLAASALLDHASFARRMETLLEGLLAGAEPEPT